LPKAAVLSFFGYFNFFISLSPPDVEDFFSNEFHFIKIGSVEALCFFRLALAFYARFLISYIIS
jgi:hypothetical protein